MRFLSQPLVPLIAGIACWAGYAAMVIYSGDKTMQQTLFILMPFVGWMGFGSLGLALGFFLFAAIRSSGLLFCWAFAWFSLAQTVNFIPTYINGDVAFGEKSSFSESETKPNLNPK